MRFAKKNVVMVESKIEVYQSNTWRSNLEEKWLWVNIVKAEYLWDNFSCETNEEEIDVSIWRKLLHLKRISSI